MAYQQLTGIANPQSIIDSACTFLAAAGWTVDRNNLSGSNRTATLRAPGGSDYIHLFNTNTTEIRMRVSVGYNAANPPNTQPNVCPADSVTNVGAGVYTNVYMHANGTEFHCIVEMAASTNYRHFVFGVAQKIGSYDGGTYIDGSWRGTGYLGTYPGAGTHKSVFGDINNSINANGNAPYPGFIRADSSSEGWTNTYHYIGPASYTSASFRTVKTSYTITPETGYDTYLFYQLLSSDVNTFSGRTILYTPKLYVKRSGSTIYYSPIAYIANTRYCNMKKLLAAQEITIGTDIWKIYPLFRYNNNLSTSSGSSDLGSYVLGYAVKKVL